MSKAEDEDGPFAGLHKASDPRELRALAHPVRLALFEALGVHGSLTATQASKLVGGSPTSVAYHLRTLAKYGYVEEAEGGGGRERPWKLRIVGVDFAMVNTVPGAGAAARALGDLIFQRWLERREHYRNHRSLWPAEVREETGDFGFVFFGTLEEFRALRDTWGRLIMQYHARIQDPSLRPADSVAYELNLFINPFSTGPDGPAESDAES
jgi:DNA-binding transcriptional ArsR family regulator